jgi:hypothetical protein
MTTILSTPTTLTIVSPGTYYTDFSGSDENPLSEGGKWGKAANVWQDVRRVGGVAKPVAYTEIYDDAYSLLQMPTPNDVEVIATLFRNGSTFAEYELMLRASDSPTTAAGYECLCNTDGGIQLMRWNGPLGQFTEVTTAVDASPGAMADGHQLRATIEGSVIQFFHRPDPASAWTLIAHADDSQYPTGKVGISFYVHQSIGNVDDVGFKDFSVTAI